MFFDPKDPRYNHCTVKEIEHLKEIMKEKIDLSLNRSLSELEDSYWEFIEATEGEDSAMWSETVQENFSALEGYLMRQDRL
tara:strand:+ start:171 stop:413 length:243 start_codon:yes stop_codon:yes gene_type:complete